MRRHILILSLLALPALACSPAAAQHSRTTKSKKTASKASVAAPVTVTVQAISEVPGGVFTLGEIAQIAGKDKALIKQLSAVEVGTSPLPGLSRDLTPGDITVKLRANHLESSRVTCLRATADAYQPRSQQSGGQRTGQGGAGRGERN